MRSILVRLLGGAALAAVLACSGLGLCWREVVLAQHDCCRSEGTTTTLVKPCAAPVAHETKVELAPPPAAAAIVILDLALDTRTARSHVASSCPATSRPAVLRI
jgi:hypothetical protein